jgi:hypothetical protein
MVPSLPLARAFGAPVVLGLLLVAAPDPAPAQEAAVLAVVDSALARISAGDMVGFTDLMVPEAVIGVVGQRDGRPYHGMRSRAEERTRSMRGDVVERGFEPQVMVSDLIAMVWLPYDLYVDGAWSHCGVDVFTLFRTPDGWRIATITYSFEQPPACRRHPDGPPGSVPDSERASFFSALASVFSSHDVFALDARSFAELLREHLGWAVTPAEVEHLMGREFRYGWLDRFLSCEDAQCAMAERGIHIALVGVAAEEGAQEVTLRLDRTGGGDGALWRQFEFITLRREGPEWRVTARRVAET